jgi:hypothetical protein
MNMTTPITTDAGMYAECLRYMTRHPREDWRHNPDDQWFLGLADFIERPMRGRMTVPDAWIICTAIVCLTVLIICKL